MVLFFVSFSFFPLICASLLMFPDHLTPLPISHLWPTYEFIGHLCGDFRFIVFNSVQKSDGNIPATVHFLVPAVFSALECRTVIYVTAEYYEKLNGDGQNECEKDSIVDVIVQEG